MATFEIVTAQWLVDHRNEVVVLDARPRADYWQGHIEGARHVEPTLLSVTRTDAPALARFHALLTWVASALGLTAQSRVVVAGAQNEVNAARVAWALAYAGVERLALLDGGLKAWVGALTDAAPKFSPTHFELKPQSRYLATADDVLAATKAGGHVIDAREREEYDGQRGNATRRGRVPGARFWDARLELDGAGRFSSAERLAPALAEVAAPGERAIVYCGGGGRASRTFVALQLAGHADAAVYPASWAEWGNVETYPVEQA